LYFSHRYSFLSCILRKDTTLYALPRANNSSFSSHPARCSILAVLLLTRACTSSMLREQRLHLLDMGLFMLDDEMLDETGQCLGAILYVRSHLLQVVLAHLLEQMEDRKSTRLNSSHL